MIFTKKGAIRLISPLVKNVFIGKHNKFKSNLLTTTIKSESKNDVELFTVLGIETSCDDTAVGIIRSDRSILGEAIKLQQEIHEPKGGVVPTLAMVYHQTFLPQVVKNALDNARLDVVRDIDVIAVTRGPGLAPCLSVGLNAAKTLAIVLGKPLIGVHHMEAHALTARLTNPELKFPFLVLLISGGHTLILLAHGINKYTQLATTLDDAIGEAFDKTARLLGLSWLKGRNGGPGAALEEFATAGDANRYQVPIPMTKEKRTKENPNMSFSGLKTSISILLEKENLDLKDLQVKRDVAAAFQATAIRHLNDKLNLAFDWCKERDLALNGLVASGGVASNKAIRTR
ncbi:13616_t:CDS:2 [Ambispora gerdemannii]|uniref:N(6)-L-threonylcarbamoyladenine synthase n=1 Tax=Ambispora gerdemannii TaxID=144530 RepID=A0A9N9CYY3_9GLOM|nr:13616_t:CDS:2 [Ambispora gerdemannii]